MVVKSDISGKSLQYEEIHAAGAMCHVVSSMDMNVTKAEGTDIQALPGA